jgi:hypothetical protein
LLLTACEYKVSSAEYAINNKASYGIVRAGLGVVFYRDFYGAGPVLIESEWERAGDVIFYRENPVAPSSSSIRL